MKDKCDLEEFCDGQKPTCPEDAFQQNGTPCPGGYCFDGSCPTLAQQCQDLWGPGEADMSIGWGPACGVSITYTRLTSSGPTGARGAADSCFAFSIPPGCNGRMYPGR